MQKQSFDLVAFVLMPEHVHLIVYPRTVEVKIERLLYAIKRPFSFRIKRWLAESDDALLDRLSVRDRRTKRSFRFWQAGGGYDRNIVSLNSLRNAVEYVHNNPVRRSLCGSPDQWKWSSWRYYHQPGDPADPDLPVIQGVPV